MCVPTGEQSKEVHAAEGNQQQWTITHALQTGSVHVFQEFLGASRNVNDAFGGADKIFLHPLLESMQDEIFLLIPWVT